MTVFGIKFGRRSEENNDSQTSTVDIERMSKINWSITSDSSVWNLTAVLRAEEHQQRPGAKYVCICPPTITAKSESVKKPRMTTAQWNVLALARADRSKV